MTVCRNCDELLDADAESERQLLDQEMNSEQDVLRYGTSLILLNIGMYIGIPISIEFYSSKYLAV